MNIVMPDIDCYILGMLTLPDLINTTCINKYFHNYVTKIPIYNQWRIIKESPIGLGGVHNVAQVYFIEACSRGFTDYAKFIITNTKIVCSNLSGFKAGPSIDISAYGGYALIYSCTNGHADTVRWLLDIESTAMYGSFKTCDKEIAFGCSCQHGHKHIAIMLDVNIHACDENAFVLACIYNQLAIAKWLVKFGEKNNTRIDIHTNEDYAFVTACKYGNIDIAKWLIQLADKYGQINIHARNDAAFASACEYGHLDIAKWLVDLGTDYAYGKINIHVDNNNAYRLASGNNYVEVTDWLLTLDRPNTFGVDKYILTDTSYWDLIDYGYQQDLVAVYGI